MYQLRKPLPPDTYCAQQYNMLQANAKNNPDSKLDYISYIESNPTLERP